MQKWCCGGLTDVYCVGKLLDMAQSAKMAHCSGDALWRKLLLMLDLYFLGFSGTDFALSTID